MLSLHIKNNVCANILEILSKATLIVLNKRLIKSLLLLSKKAPKGAFLFIHTYLSDTKFI